MFVVPVGLRVVGIFRTLKKLVYTDGRVFVVKQTCEFKPSIDTWTHNTHGAVMIVGVQSSDWACII